MSMTGLEKAEAIYHYVLNGASRLSPSDHHEVLEECGKRVKEQETAELKAAEQGNAVGETEAKLQESQKTIAALKRRKDELIRRIAGMDPAAQETAEQLTQIGPAPEQEAEPKHDVVLARLDAIEHRHTVLAATVHSRFFALVTRIDWIEAWEAELVRWGNSHNHTQIITEELVTELMPRIRRDRTPTEGETCTEPTEKRRPSDEHDAL